MDQRILAGMLQQLKGATDHSFKLVSEDIKTLSNAYGYSISRIESLEKRHQCLVESVSVILTALQLCAGESLAAGLSKRVLDLCESTRELLTKLQTPDFPQNPPPPAKSQD